MMACGPADVQQQRPGRRPAALHAGRPTRERGRAHPRADQPQRHDAQQTGTAPGPDPQSGLEVE